MSDIKQLKDLMSEELPGISYQKKRLYRTNKKEVYKLFRIINNEVFEGVLPEPTIIVKSHMRKTWGECTSFYNRTKGKKSKCVLTLNHRWYCKQWLITILAHEMAHQYQWDIIGEERIKEGRLPLLGHGPSFYVFKKKLKEHNIALKARFSIAKWFDTQNLFKC